MAGARRHSDDSRRLAQRCYVAQLLAGLSLEAVPPNRVGICDDGLLRSGIGYTLPATDEELDEIFAAVTLRREIESGCLDPLGRFDETAANWDVSRPWVDLRAAELFPGDHPAATNGKRVSTFRVIITHDVDRVSGFEPTALLKNAVGRLGLWPASGRVPTEVRRKHWLKNLEKLLAFESESGVGALYFLLSGPYGLGRHSSRYDSRWTQAREAIRLISDAGMTVGLHGSYSAREKNSYGDERRRLEDAAGTAVTCHRNHYLRFDPLRIWAQLGDAGIQYDFSVGFNSRVGFRAGCARLYPTFDLSREVPSSVTSVPLLLMDTALLRGNRADILKQLRTALEDVKRVGGCVALLFHPENFLREADFFSTFQEVLETCASLGADLSGELPAPAKAGR